MVDTLLLVNGVYSLIITVTGIIGNLLIFVTTFRVKKNTTFIFLRFVSISDLVTLFFFNLDSFTQPVYDVYLENLSILSCKWVMFLQFSSMQVSAWLLVITYIRKMLKLRTKMIFNKENSILNLAK